MGARSRTLTRAPRAALLAGALATAALLAGCGGSARQAAQTSAQSGQASGFAGAALPAGIRAPRFVLTDQAGRPVALGGRSSQVTVVSFVDTDCGRVCPLMAQQVRGALDRLARPVRTVFVSVDPQRDSPDRVARFLSSASLTGRALYVTGPSGSLPRVWRAYRVVTPAAGRAAFQRSVSVLLIDRAGIERVIYQQEQLTPEALVADIGKLQGPAQRG
jgi:protein SCO1/2